MGLKLAQIAVKTHGGTIELTSNEDIGTLFTITLLKNFNKPGKRRTKLTFVNDQKLIIYKTVDL